MPLNNKDIEFIGQALIEKNYTVADVIEQFPDHELPFIFATDGYEVTHGTSQLDWMIGTSERDIMYGWGGNDSLLGNDGNDRLHGGDGNDRIDGGDGKDSAFGDGGDDRIFGGSGDDTLYGGSGQHGVVSGNDRIDGGSGSDFINGEDGDDYLIGGTGEDTISGGIGNDIIYGDNETPSSPTFGVLLDDTLSGGAGNDHIFGGDGDDTINGGEDEDVIQGGHGDDDLWGDGQGSVEIPEPARSADRFVYAEHNWGDDTIHDFDDGLDLIDFSQHTGIAGMADFTLSQNASNDAVITYTHSYPGPTGNAPSTSTITLVGIDIADVNASDFVF